MEYNLKNRIKRENVRYETWKERLKNEAGRKGYTSSSWDDIIFNKYIKLIPWCAPKYVDFERVFKELCASHLESVVAERWGF